MIENRFTSLNEKELLEVLRDFEIYVVEGSIPENGLLAEIRDYYCDRSDIRGVRLMEQDLLLVCSHRLCDLLEEKERKNGRKVYNWQDNGPFAGR